MPALSARTREVARAERFRTRDGEPLLRLYHEGPGQIREVPFGVDLVTAAIRRDFTAFATPDPSRTVGRRVRAFAADQYTFGREGLGLGIMALRYAGIAVLGLVSRRAAQYEQSSWWRAWHLMHSKQAQRAACLAELRGDEDVVTDALAAMALHLRTYAMLAEASGHGVVAGLTLRALALAHHHFGEIEASDWSAREAVIYLDTALAHTPPASVLRPEYWPPSLAADDQQPRSFIQFMAGGLRLDRSDLALERGDISVAHRLASNARQSLTAARADVEVECNTIPYHPEVVIGAPSARVPPRTPAEILAPMRAGIEALLNATQERRTLLYAALAQGT